MAHYTSIYYAKPPLLGSLDTHFFGNIKGQIPQLWKIPRINTDNIICAFRSQHTHTEEYFDFCMLCSILSHLKYILAYIVGDLVFSPTRDWEQHSRESVLVNQLYQPIRNGF